MRKLFYILLAALFLTAIFFIVEAFILQNKASAQDQGIVICNSNIPKIIWNCEFEPCTVQNEPALAVWGKNENLPAVWRNEKRFFFPLSSSMATILEKILPDAGERYLVAIHDKKVDPQDLSPRIYFVFSRERIDEMEKHIPVIDRTRMSRK